MSEWEKSLNQKYIIQNQNWNTMYSSIRNIVILVSFFLCLNTNGQAFRSEDKLLIEHKNIFYLSYLSSVPILKTPTPGDLDSREYEELSYYHGDLEGIVFIEFKVKTLDVYFTKKAFDEYLNIYSISHDSLPNNNGHYMVDKQYNAVIVFKADTRKKMNTVNKEYMRLKESFSRKFPIVLGMEIFNSAEVGTLHASTYYYYDYYYIKDFNYFDKLIKVE